MESLENLRGQLDEIDREIVSSSARDSCSDFRQNTASWRPLHMPLQSPGTRSWPFLPSGNLLRSSDFNRKGIRELYQQLMSMSRKLQYRLLVEAGALERLPLLTI